jgi:hypothetical protein
MKDRNSLGRTGLEACDSSDSNRTGPCALLLSGSKLSASVILRLVSLEVRSGEKINLHDTLLVAFELEFLVLEICHNLLRAGPIKRAELSKKSGVISDQ